MAVDLEQATNLRHSATPGPWSTVPAEGGMLIFPGRGGPIAAMVGSQQEVAADAEFIVQAHRLWPAMCSEIQRLRGELEAAHRLLAASNPLPVNRCEDCGGSLDRRRVDEAGVIVEGCVCDGPYGEPTWAGM
jgi:hypothetical protein